MRKKKDQDRVDLNVERIFHPEQGSGVLYIYSDRADRRVVSEWFKDLCKVKPDYSDENGTQYVSVTSISKQLGLDFYKVRQGIVSHVKCDHHIAGFKPSAKKKKGSPRGMYRLRDLHWLSAAYEAGMRTRWMKVEELR